MRLYRPVGKNELVLIEQNGFAAFPERLPEQPIFYPVLNLEYARYIASNWNKPAGYVTMFEINDDYIGRFEVHTVGSHIHQEYWIPADELKKFNENIIGTIKILHAVRRLFAFIK